MKKLGKIKLNEFSKSELDQRKLNALKGGCICAKQCGCLCLDWSVTIAGGMHSDEFHPIQLVYNY